MGHTILIEIKLKISLQVVNKTSAYWVDVLFNKIIRGGIYIYLCTFRQ